MSRHNAVALLVLAALTLALPMAASAAATDLKCQARATYASSPLPVDVSFEALAGDGQSPFAFEWEFGDGATSTEQNPSHTYTTTDIFSAILRVTDSATPPLTCLDTVVVFVGVVADPTCIASADVRWGDAPLSVGFAAFPVFGPDPHTWTWRFGDGQSGVGQQTTHGYAEPGTYWIVATAHADLQDYDCATIRISALSHDVADADPLVDGVLRLEAARPNPFRAMAAIGFNIPRPGPVRPTILDLSGRSVARLLNGQRPAGRGVGIWQGRASSGRPAPAGLYFARLDYEGV